MNRAERRRQGAKEKPRTYVLTDQQIQKIKDDAVQDALNIAVTCIIGLPVRLMRTKYKWGNKKRLPELADDLIDMIEDFYTGKITADELAKEIEELGIKVERRQRNGKRI